MVNCSSCGKRVKKALSVRAHVCKSCGTVLDRDHNAAINIEKVGLDLLGLCPTV
ncbi:transposase [Salicibibacter kimchii]|uniref:transposase n=1 Tax=Salicibibacter kimchii TaxID=2099786 RepID=UPI001D041E71|nr:transposase [Salicibibacter kimchii]